MKWPLSSHQEWGVPLYSNLVTPPPSRDLTLQEISLPLQERQAHKASTQQLQEQLDEASIARRKVEEQLQFNVGGPGKGESEGVLEEIQSKYAEEVGNLTSEIRVKDKTLQDMRARRITLVSSVGWGGGGESLNIGRGAA